MNKMSEKTNKELKLMFDNLKEQIEDLNEDMNEGFRKVHERQDITNGKVEKNKSFREKQKTRNNFIYSALTLVVIPAIFVAVEYILSLI